MLRLCLLVLVLTACEERRRNRAPIDRDQAAALFEEIQIATPPGISDLTVDGRGVLWAIAERDRAVLEIEIGKAPIVHELKGVTLGIDTEAIAWLGNGTFAIGIEGAMSPAAGVMYAELRGNDVVVTSTRPLLDKDLGVALTINHGIEAVCGRDGELLVASETVGMLPDGKRWAPIVRLHGETTQVTRLWLTSRKGKISALHCTIADDGVAQVTAIERHFGVVRLLRFTIDRDDTDATPTVDLDLYPVLHDNFNLEGITRLPDGRFVIINDNQSKKVDGPTQLFVLKPR